jgi:hypothetical protein
VPSQSGGDAGAEEYLVAARTSGPDAARDMQEVVSRVAKLPGAKVVESKRAASGHLVVRMSAQQAAGLRAAFGGRIIIEPNAELRF